MLIQNHPFTLSLLGSLQTAFICMKLVRRKLNEKPSGKKSNRIIYCFFYKFSFGGQHDFLYFMGWETIGDRQRLSSLLNCELAVSSDLFPIQWDIRRFHAYVFITTANVHNNLIEFSGKKSPHSSECSKKQSPHPSI